MKAAKRLMKGSYGRITSIEGRTTHVKVLDSGRLITNRTELLGKGSKVGKTRQG